MSAIEKYAELDKAILETLAGRSMKFSALCESMGFHPYMDGGRDVDRRLQAMRKRGLVAIDRKTGWSVK